MWEEEVEQEKLESPRENSRVSPVALSFLKRRATYS